MIVHLLTPEEDITEICWMAKLQGQLDGMRGIEQRPSLVPEGLRCFWQEGWDSAQTDNEHLHWDWQIVFDNIRVTA